MIKPQKNSPKVSLKDLQQNREELDRCKKNPVYYYNKYIRKEGQPVLSEEEYSKWMVIEFNRKKYPLTPNDAFKIIDDAPNRD